VEVHRDPDSAAARYLTIFSVAKGELTPAALPGFSLADATLFD